MTSVSSSNALSVIGFFLTLVGLLGSFFNIHLGDWYREVLALTVKWQVNRFGDDPDQKAGRRECRYEAEKAAIPVILVTTGAVTCFVLSVSVLSIMLWLAEPSKDRAWAYIGIVGVCFLFLYLALTLGFLVTGYTKARQVLRAVQEKMAAPKE